MPREKKKIKEVKEVKKPAEKAIIPLEIKPVEKEVKKFKFEFKKPEFPKIDISAKLKAFMRKIFPRKTELPEFMISKEKYIIALPTDKKINVRYPLIPPFAYVNIKWDWAAKEMLYNVIEPKLNEDEEKIYEKIMKGLLEIVEVELTAMEGAKAIEYIATQVQRVIKEYELKLTPEQYLKIMYHIYRNFIGLNEIEPLMQDPYIEDVSCNGIGINLYIVHRKYGSIKTNVIYKDPKKLSEFVVKLSERCGRYISYAEPLLGGTLPDGSRVQASIAADVTTRGPTFSIRKFTAEPLTPIDLLDFGTVSPELLAFLWLGVENGSSFLICGGVATGKTTLLNTLSMFIPSESKIVSIEDTRELALPHENWIPSVVRTGFGVPTPTGEKYGEITMFDLLKQSFRQNPDYVIVGEIRGAEAYVMFQGMSSGHPCLGTMHAGKVEDVIHRLETPPIELPPSLIETLDAIIVMVHARERGAAARRVKEVVEIESIDPRTGRERTNRVFSWLPSTDSFEFRGYSWLLGKISKLKGIPVEKLQREIKKRTAVLSWMQKSGIKHFKRVAEIFSEYNKDPEKILKLAGYK